VREDCGGGKKVVSSGGGGDVRNRARGAEGKFWRVGDGLKSGDSYVTTKLV